MPYIELSNEQFNQYSDIIDEKLHETELFKIFVNELPNFNKIAIEHEKNDINFSFSSLSETIEHTKKFYENEYKNYVLRLQVIKQIIIECKNIKITNSFFTLFDKQLKQISGRNYKKVLAVLQKFVNVKNVLNENYFWTFYDVLSNNIPILFRQEFQLLNSIVIFSKIKSIDSNIVLIGANGSGKSRFSRTLAQSKGTMTPIAIIPAQHFLGFEPFDSMQNADFAFQIQNNDTNAKLGFVNSHEYLNDFQTLIKLLQTNYNECARRRNIEKSLFCKVSKMFKQLIKKRTLIYDDNISVNLPKASTLDGVTYEINDMSDGEKTILYFLIHVLNAKKDSFIIVDEPENHLHFDACCSLWNALESERSDCTFLYLTHNIDFALSRKNVSFIWNKNFVYPDEWEIQVLDNIDVPKNVYFDILGVVPPILYCEGKYDSIDKEIYQTIYPNFIIKECKSCDYVFQYKVAISKLNLEKNKEIFAVIDRDCKCEEEIENRYEKNNIHVLKVVEAENLLFVPEIAKEIFAEKFEQFIEIYFETCKRQINFIVSRKLKYICKDKICGINSSHFFDIYSSDESARLSLENIEKQRTELLKKYEKIIDDKDYEKSLSLFDLKNDLFEAANRVLPNYRDFALKLIAQEDRIKSILATKYIGIDNK